MNNQNNFGYHELLTEWKNEIKIGGITASHIAKKFGTPVFVYDLELIERKYNALRQRLSKNVKIFYAMKANSNIAVARKLASLGCGADIASKGEFLVAKKADFKEIIFSGPGKTSDQIKTVGKILSYHIESLSEAKRIVNIFPNQLIGIRTNASFEVKNGTIVTSGGCQKFGIDEEQLPTAIQELKKLKLNIAGLHCFSASGVLDAKVLAENVKKIILLTERIEKECGINFEYIDIGGGLGVPYNDEDDLFDLDSFCHTINELASHRKLWIELGRFLVAESGVFLTRVIDTKQSRGKNIAITDGGINNMLRPAILQEHPIVKADSLKTDKTDEYYIGGQLCTSLDYFAKNIKLPKLQEGDLLALLNAGAYGFAESMPFFLGHDIAGEVAVEKGKVKSIRKKIKAETYLLG